MTVDEIKEQIKDKLIELSNHPDFEGAAEVEFKKIVSSRLYGFYQRSAVERFKVPAKNEYKCETTIFDRIAFVKEG